MQGQPPRPTPHAEIVLQEGAIDDSEFNVPKICPEKPELGSAGRFQKHVGGLARMRSLLPNAHYGERCFHESSHVMRVSHAMKVVVCHCLLHDRPVARAAACLQAQQCYVRLRHEAYLWVLASAILQRRVS